MEHELPLQRLKQALQGHHQALKKPESALIEFEESISGEASLRPQEEEEQRGGVQLLSIPQLCAKSLVWARAGSIGACAVGRSLA